MALKSKMAVNGAARSDRAISTRLKIPAGPLAAYIRKHGAANERALNPQIIYMLKFAAAQMSAHDIEGAPAKGDN